LVDDLSEEIIRSEDADPAMFGGDNSRTLDYLLRRWLAVLEPSRRFNAVAPMAKHSPGLPLIAKFVRSLGPDRNLHGSHEQGSLLTEHELASIRSIVLERIRKIAKDGLLWSVSDPAAILWSWWAMGENDEAKTWVKSQIADTDSGHSAAQIATRLGHSRNAVCAKLLRLGLRRAHKPPTAKPKIVSVPKRKPALLAACARPVHKVVSTRKPVVRQPKEPTKAQLNAMLAEAAANTARLLR
jgi:GcrA cell cycle regulator